MSKSSSRRNERFRPRPARRRNRVVEAGHDTARIDYITCEPHGKRGYLSRADAREVAKIMRRRHEAETIEAYPCGAVPDLWHVGNSNYRGEHNERTFNRDAEGDI